MLTVYAFTCEPPRGLKRKRSDDGSTLLSLCQAVGFNPTGLIGRLSDEWLKAIIRDMFPGPAGRTRITWPSPAWDLRALPKPRSEGSSTLAYLAIGPAVRGKFLVDRAKARGLKPGPAFAALTRGERVTAPDGSVVEPSDCMEPGSAAAGFAVLDVPDRGTLAATAVQAARIRETAEKRGAALKVVFYWLGAGVVDDPAFVELAKSFGDVRHIIACPELSPNRITFGPATLNQLRLARLDPTVFPLPSYTLGRGRALPLGAEVWSQALRIPMRNQTSIIGQQMIPPRDFEFAVPSDEAAAAEAQLKPHTDKPDDAKTHAAAKSVWEHYVELAADAVRSVERATPPPPRPGDDLRVIPLGTGSSKPATYRNGP